MSGKNRRSCPFEEPRGPRGGKGAAASCSTGSVAHQGRARAYGGTGKKGIFSDQYLWGEKHSKLLKEKRYLVLLSLK